MSKNILLVVNPISGDIDKTEVIQIVQNALPETYQLEIYETTGEKDAEEIRLRVVQFKPERVISAGGDGTIKLIAEAARNKDFILGILPLGSANGLATDLGLAVDIATAVKVAFGNSTQNVDAICIDDHLCLHISDLGINAELIANYSEGNIRGKFGYALHTIPTLISSEMPYAFTVKANGKSQNFEGIMLAIANSKKFGTGAVINPNGKIDDGKFEILVFKKLDVIEIIKTLGNEVELDPEFVDCIQTTEAAISCKKAIHFQIDGEAYGKVKNLKVNILPNALKVAVP